MPATKVKPKTAGQQKNTGKNSREIKGNEPRVKLDKRAKKARSKEQSKLARTKVLKVIACLIILLLCGFLARFVGNEDYEATVIGWIPLIVAVCAIILARIYISILRKGLLYKEETDMGDCKRGENIRFTTRFKNKTPLFFFRIEAHFYMSDLFGNIASENMTTLALAPFEETELEFTVRFEHIGTYSAGLKKVVLCDFLRLFTVTIESPKKRIIDVIPKIQPIKEIRFSNDAVIENTKALKATLSDSMDYAYVREYIPGDPMKTIHWKLSARGGALMTRLFEVYTNPGVSIIMDFYAPSDQAKILMGMFDTVVETAFSVGGYAKSQGMETEIHYYNKYGERVKKNGWSTKDLPEIVGELPRISNKEEKQLDALDLLQSQIRSQYGQNNLLICTSNLSSLMISAVIEAKSRRREPMLFAVIPKDLIGRERTEYCSSLKRLDVAGIGYVILTSSDDLMGGRA